MSNTIDTLVRMLDEERTKKYRAREEASKELGRRLQTEMDNQHLERRRDELDKDLKALNAYCDRLIKLVPAKRRKLAGERPSEEIPF